MHVDGSSWGMRGGDTAVADRGPEDTRTWLYV